MPTRDKYPKKYFEGNPMEGETPLEIYKRLQWGNEPNEVVEVDAPEPLVALGHVAKLVLEDRIIEWDEGEAFLAVGADSNRLYIFPVGTTEIPHDGYEEVSQADQTDYTSAKGEGEGEPKYYFHEHETPFPMVHVHAQSGDIFVIEPETVDGERSYAVSDEGIIG